MKAVIIEKYGDPEELKYKDIAVPEVNPDEVLIKVFATSINPIDWKIRKGLVKDLAWAFPVILGWDVSGVVEKVGDKVNKFKPGDEVYAFPALSRKGTYAEYVAVKENEVAYKPKTIDHLESASIPLAGLTAWQAIFYHGKLRAGKKILIIGAAGGVGTLAIQLARTFGAYVIGTTSEKNLTFLKELGAHEVINYNTENFEDKVNDIDVVLDCIGGHTQEKAIQVLKPGGILVSIVGINKDVDFQKKKILPVFFLTKSVSKQLAYIAKLIDSGKLKPVVAQVMPLKEIEKAHVLSEEGHTRGKIVIKVQE